HLGAECTQHIESAHAGQHEVEHQEIVSRLHGQCMQHTVTCLDDRYVERALFKSRLDDPRYVRLIVDYEHPVTSRGIHRRSVHTRAAICARWRRRSYSSAARLAVGVSSTRSSASADTDAATATP